MMKSLVKRWVSGSEVVKKSNAADHLKSNIHSTAVKQLKEKKNATTEGQQTATTESQQIAASTSQEKTIPEYVRALSKPDRAKLTKNSSLYIS